jgi:hypothetical protein
MTKRACWDAAAVYDAIDTEALQTPDEYFLACHSPMVARRADRDTGVRQQESVPQGQLLQELLDPRRRHVQFVVLGESGTGKSHLVRWLFLHCPPNEKRHVLLVRKSGTNLRQIIESILGSFKGGRFDELRDRLEHARERVTADTARRELLHFLSRAVGSDGPFSHQHYDDPEDCAYRDGITASLPALLDDAVFREPLLADGAIVDQISQHLYGTPGYQRLEARRVFSEEDFRCEDPMARHKRMNEVAGRFYLDIQDDPKALRMVVERLNRNLDLAKRQLLGLQSEDLTKLMMDVREELLQQGRELVMFVEDFAKFDGVQMELLDALTTRPEQGERHLCVLRSVVAMTRGYYVDLHETLRTRVDSAINVDIDYTQQQQNRLPEFAARYLNATRLTRAQLKRWHKRATAQTDGTETPPPSACADCDRRIGCHEAFRAVAEVGLFPFNHAALARLYALEASKQVFDPRVLLNHVLQPVLEMGPDLDKGEFPRGLLPEGKGDMDARTQHALDQRVAPERKEQYRALVELWGSPAKLALPAGVPEAFGLEMIGEALAPADGDPPEAMEDAIRTEPPVDKPAAGVEPRAVKELDKWSDGGEMSQRLANELRSLLYRAVDAHIDWDSEFLLAGRFRGEGAPFTGRSIGFEGQSTRQSAAFSLQLPLPGWDRVRTALALQAMLRNDDQGNWQFEGGVEDYARYAELVDDLSRHVLGRLRDDYGGGRSAWDPVRAAVELLVVGACLQGVRINKDTPPEQQISALFVPPSPGGLSSDSRSAAWRQLERAFRDNLTDVRNSLLAHIGCTKGGSSQMQVIDAATVVPHIRSFLKHPTLSEVPPPRPPDMYRRLASLSEAVRQHLGDALVEEVQAARDWRKELITELGPDDHSAFAGELVKVMEAAHQAGRSGLQVEAQSELRALARQFADLPLRQQLNAVERLSEKQDPLGALSTMGSDDLVRTADTSRRFLRFSSAFVKNTTARIATDLRHLEVSQRDVITIEKVNQALQDVCDLLQDICSRGGGHDAP